MTGRRPALYGCPIDIVTLKSFVLGNVYYAKDHNTVNHSSISCPRSKLVEVQTVPSARIAAAT